jgi:hypothetical protein
MPVSPATAGTWTETVTGSAVSSGNTGWMLFRSQAWPVQALVWIFALPVPIWLWALQLTKSRVAGLALATAITVCCVAIPLASGSTDRRSAPPPTAGVPAAPSSDPPTSGPTTSPERPTTPTSGPPSSPPPAPPETTPPAAAALSATDLISRLRVGPETSDVGYSRDLFNHWIDADGDGCDTRCEVLAIERAPSLPGLPDGGWISVYDGMTTSDPSELDIDHVVALAEAWRSGASTWDSQRRAAFANDLDEPRSLIAVSASSNRSKSDGDPSDWRPPAESYWCEFATAWMTVKLRWGLLVDPIEFTALQFLSDTCS